jgi:hypothetical protein
MNAKWNASGRGLIGQCCIVLVLMASASGASLADTPQSDIYVSNGQKFEKSEVLLSGEATADDGVASVRVAVKDRASKRWLQSDGSWGKKRFWHQADLSSPGAPTTPWLFRKSLRSGKYSVTARAKSVSGISQSTDRPTRKLQVVKDRPDLKASKRWLTIQFDRSAWGAAGGGRCSPYTDPVNGSVFLDEIASYLTERGYTAQGSVPFGHFDPDPAERKCPWPGHISASLNDLVELREDHGWTFVADSVGPLPSDSSLRPGMSDLTCDDQITAATASLAELQKFGHVRGWGLIGGPNAGWTTGIRDNIASRFYSFSRLYGNNLKKTQNTEQKALDGDWAYFRSVSGGLCNDPDAECYDHNVRGSAATPIRYRTPEELLPYMIAEPGTWRGVQFYRLVRGAQVPEGYPGTDEEPAGRTLHSYWDCTSNDPNRHWTSQAELYCFEDFADVVETLHRDYPDVITTDAAHVATTWGIDNPNHEARYPTCKCQDDSDCSQGRTCQGGRCKKE